MKIKNKKRVVFCFPFFYENEKRMRTSKIQNKKSIKHENGTQLFDSHFSY